MAARVTPRPGRPAERGRRGATNGMYGDGFAEAGSPAVASPSPAADDEAAAVEKQPHDLAGRHGLADEEHRVAYGERKRAELPCSGNRVCSQLFSLGYEDVCQRGEVGWRCAR